MMSRERVAFLGVDGRGWYVQTRRGAIRFLTRIKIFYPEES